MEIGINTYKDLIELIALIVTSLSLIGLWISYAFSKKQMHFSTMDKCTKSYKDFLTLNSEIEDEIALEYIELVNEEFFYFENNYLPIEVMIEWIDGMIGFLPFYNKNGEFVKSRVLGYLKVEENANNLLYNYPRVRNAIQLTDKIDFDKVYLPVMDKKKRKKRKKERDKLIYNIITNLKIGIWSRILLKRKIANS
ncbi:hypothetical protein ACFO3O_17915 [Dokdonia ponticola]|uniref:Uncharacterized protein n=1 Tax=Dokdonia ponticola TaxID=2041041 RepID=A0ABV9I039_9FLAO